MTSAPDPLPRVLATEPTTDGGEGLTPGLLAAAAFLIALLLGFGWYLGTRAGDERLNAVVAELPGSQRYSDNFSRDPSSTTSPMVLAGEAPSGARWNTIGTLFTLADGRASISISEEDETGIAIIDTGWSDANIGATVESAPAGTGLVFRFRDIDNYWALTSVPVAGTWNLLLVVDGDVALSEPVGLASVRPGARISVLMQGPEIQTFVNGDPLLRIINPHFETATAAGLISPGSSGGSFSDFFAIEADRLTDE